MRKFMKEGRKEGEKIENKRGQEKVWERRRVGSGNGKEESPSSATQADNDQMDTSDKWSNRNAQTQDLENYTYAETIQF